MISYFQKQIKMLVKCVAIIGLLMAGIDSSRAQGIGFYLDSSSYSVVQGGTFYGNVGITPVYDFFDDYYSGYGFTYYGFYTDWYVHTEYDVLTAVELSGSGISSVSQEVDFSANNYGSVGFAIWIPNGGSPGPDLTGTLSVDSYDPYSDPYDSIIGGNPYYGLCEFIYCDTDYYSSSPATLTVYNPNSVMNVEIVGSSQLTEGEASQNTTFRIFREDTYNTRNVYYTIGGNAQNGSDYTASLSDYVTIAAGSDHADIEIATLPNANLLELDEPSTLTLTLNADSLYQLGDEQSVTVSFQNGAVEDGTAQLTRSTQPTLNDQNIGRAKNGNAPVSGGHTNFAFNSSSAIVNVWPTAPYATSAGPTAGEFTITRSGSTSNSFTLNYTVTGTAIAGTNYTALPSYVIFATNQLSTNLLVNVLTNLVMTNAQTVVLTLTNGTNYFLGYSPQTVVTILPTGMPTNSVVSPTGRYWRGTGKNPTYWSQVIPLDAETGTVYSNTNGNCSSLYAGLTSWNSNTLYHYNATNTLSQTGITNRIPFNNPLVAFGERVGGTPLYFGQPYNFGVYAGDPLLATQQIVVQVYYRTNFHLAGSIKIIPPVYTNAASMAAYATNGFQVTTNAFGLSTTLADSPGLSWGTTSLGAYELTQTATSQSTNYYYLVEVSGYPADGTNAMVTATNGTAAAPSLLYTLEFEPRPAWRSIFLDQPQFAGNPLPPYYSGKTLAEMLTNTPPVTNLVTIAPSAATNLNDSPEVWRHPILDRFVASMGNDPIALANYVINNIDLTDPMGYSDNGNVAEQSIDPGGVSRDALGTFMEKQGSAVEQCELLVYLLRQAGVPAVYEFAPRSGLQILNARLSQMLKFQIQGGVNEAGQLFTTNTMIPVNYPWVAAYIGTNWVHIFPWLKDYEITEGFNLWEYMPTNYSSAYPWARDFVFGNTNLLSLAVNGDNTPRVIFPAYLQQTLRQNYPGISVDDIGVQILNRQHYYARWQDFPTPTYVTNVSTSLESLTSPGITNISPTLTNVFDTVSVEVYSLNNVTNNIQTGSLRLCDLHNREFYIYQAITNTVQTNLVQLSLILSPFNTNITTQLAYSNDTNLLSREVLSMTLQPSDNQLSVRLVYQRHRALAPSYAINPAATFAGINAVETVDLERPLLKGDQAAICMDYGRVTPDMLNVYATDLWQMENQLQLNPSLTNSLSPDVYLGVPMYLAGLSYYKEVSDFTAQNERLNKINILSTWAVGLSKMGAARDANGNLTNGIDPVLPSVDMSFYQTTEVGNGTVQPNSNQTLEMAQQNFDLLSILDNSAEEHRVLNHFYQQTNAVSTVRLLQLAQSGGQGIVSLNYNNYVSQGAAVYQGSALQNWDPSLWSQVTAAFQNAYDGNYVTTYITPGPITNSAYSGMAALILGWGQWQALITPQSLNGAFGENFPPNTIAPENTVNFFLDGSDDPTLSTTAVGAGTVLAPTSATAGDLAAELNQILNQGDILTSFDTTWSAVANNTLNPSATGTPRQTDASALTASVNQGFFGNIGAALSQAWTSVSDPVQPVTGEHYIAATDLQLPGPLPLTLRRNYSSQNLADNQFGTGWKLSLMPYLSVAVGATNIYAADMDGAVLAYVQTATNANVWIPTLSANPQLNNNTSDGAGGLANRLRDRLVQTVSGSTTNYTLYGADGSTRSFQVVSFNNGIVNQTRPYLQQWTDSRGNFYTFTFGTNSTQPNFGQVTRIQSSNGNYLGFDYDVSAHILDAYSGDGRRVTYEYDEYGDLITVTQPDDNTLSYIYQHATQAVTNGTATYSTHLLIEEDKPEGRVLQNLYDSQRRVTNQWSTAGATLVPIPTATLIYFNNFSITNSYTNGISGYTLIIDANNHTNRYDYTNCLITKITDPLGQTIQQTWYPDTATAPGYPRSLQQTVDKRGLVTQFKYDGNGNVINAVVTGDLTGDGITTQTATNTAVYNTNSLPVQMTDPAGNSTVIVYDPIFNFLPQQVIRYAGATAIGTNFMYYGNATNVVADGSLTQTNLAFGLKIREIRAANSPDAATNDLVYNGNGFPTETIGYSGTTDPNIVYTFFYNERGQMVNQVDSLGAVTSLAYDAMGRTIEQDIYDENGNDLSLNFLYYNGNGELNWTEGPRYNPEDYVYYDYDGAGRRTTEIHWRSQANATGNGVTAPAGYNLYAQAFCQFDPLGNPLLTVDPRGAMTTNSFDSLCRLVHTTHLDTNGVTVLSADGYGYEPGGLPQTHTNALGGVTTTFYNITGKPEYQINPNGSTNGWRYYLDGRIKKQIHSNGAYWQTTYDDVNRITTNIFYSAAGVPEATNSVQHDRRGNVVQRIDEAGNAFATTFDGLDRVKVAAGPAIVTINASTGISPSGPATYTTNVLQQISTNFFDAAGRAETNVNALGETRITRRDALGRASTNLIYNAAGVLVREHYTAYSADHNSMTVTDGSGTNAIVHTTWTDADGRTVLAIANPSATTTEFTLNQYDLAGNLVAAQHDSSSGGTITTWTTNSFAYDGLNRATGKVDRDGAITTCAFDALGDVTNRTLPGGSVHILATFNNAGQKTADWLVGGTSGTRTNTYTYFPSGSPFAGLLQTSVDGRLTTNTYFYDDRLRLTNQIATGLLPEQNMTISWQYEPRGHVINYSEQFASTNTGPATSVQRTFNPYGELATESVNDGSFVYSAGQTFDSAGRRTMLNIGGANYGFAWRADNALAFASDPTGNGNYSYDTAGILTNRLATGGRNTAIVSRDGEGRPLAVTNTLNTLSELGETMVWSGDGLLSSHTLARPDFTDNHSYSYANMSRRVTQELLNLNGSTIWTNSFVYDRGAAGGPGALTTAGPIGASFGLWWSGIPDAFARVNAETNNAVGYLAYGAVNGQSTLSAWLDNQPIQIMDVGTNNMQWRTFVELTQGAHQLKVSALHPSGFFTAYATNSFTNSIPYQVTADSYDGSGNITNRVWRNASGATNRTQTLSWDAKGRLRLVTERNANNYGFNWTAVYDGLNRRIATTTILVSNGVPSTITPQVLSSYYDPQVEFLELGVLLSAAPAVEFLEPGTSPGVQTIWKLYGPDLNGTYGGRNGTGGLEGISPYLNSFYPVISDARGNVLAEVTNGVASWILARPTGYGAVPGYRPVSFGNGVDLAQSSAWRGREVDVTGYYHLGLRDYDPDSGQWLSYDPAWNAGDPNGQTYCGGDPVNGVDSDGKCVETSIKSANAFAGWVDDTAINQVIGAGVLGNQLIAAVTGDPFFTGQAQQWQSAMSPYARQGVYDATSLSAIAGTQVANAGMFFVNPGSAEVNIARDVGESSVITDPARLLPENSTPTTVTSPSFYVTADGTAIPATGYRAVGGPAVEQAEAGNLMSANPQTYVTFTDISGMGGADAKSVLQLEREPSHYATFDTLQIIDDLSVPTGRWGTSSIMEPITTTFPEYGIGGATQATTKTPILNYTLQPFKK